MKKVKSLPRFELRKFARRYDGTYTRRHLPEIGHEEGDKLRFGIIEERIIGRHFWIHFQRRGHWRTEEWTGWSSGDDVLCVWSGGGGDYRRRGGEIVLRQGANHPVRTAR